jgi:hypothetical protein
MTRGATLIEELVRCPLRRVQLAERFHKSRRGLIRSSDGYSVRIVGPTGIDYSDPDGELRIDSEVMARPSREIVVYTTRIPDTPERPRQLVVDRLDRALGFDGWHLALQASVDHETSEPVAAYFEYAHSKDEGLFWAWEAVDAEGWHDPEHKWQLILALLDAAASEHEVGLVAAGPLEDLLKMYGRDFIDRIEGESRSNVKLRAALAGVWLRGPLRPDPDAIADRVDRIVAESSD